MEANLGYFGIEFDKLSLGLNKSFDFTTKLTVEIKNSSNSQIKTFKWQQSNNEYEKIDSDNFTNVSEPNSESGLISNLTSFENFSPKSTYINLNEKTINELCNSEIIIQVKYVSSDPIITQSTKAATTPVAKPAKGKTADATAAPIINTDDILFELIIPCSQLMSSRSSSLDFNESNNLDSFASIGITCNTINQTLIVPSKSYLKFKIYSDNDLSEFIYGGGVYQYKFLKLSELSSDMTLRVVDAAAAGKAAAGGKGAKGGASNPADLKTKAIEGLGKLVEEQSKYVSYDLNLDIQEQQNEWQQQEQEQQVNRSIITDSATCQGGKVNFDKVAATGSSEPEVDFNSAKELWSSKYSLVSFMF